MLCCAAQYDVYYRTQALKFLQVCLASVMNLRPPADCVEAGQDATVDKMVGLLAGQLPPPHIPDLAVKVSESGRHAASQPASSQYVSLRMVPDVWLFSVAYLSVYMASNAGVLHFFIISILLPPVLQGKDGVKTKTQLVAERQVFVQLLASVIGGWYKPIVLFMFGALLDLFFV